MWIALLFPFTASAQSSFESITRAVKAGDYQNIHSILIQKQGKNVYERYFNGYTRDSLHDTRSAFKSVTSLLVGIAVDKGLISNIDQPVYQFFPENKAFAADPLKRQIRIKDLLEMRAGFDCEEWNDGKDCESEMEQQRDWVKFSLSLPMKHKPGTVWAYTSCDPMILSGVIEKASGMSVMDFAGKYLFTPPGDGAIPLDN
ncbi:serine hydrolase domain-containing protein [Hufsiella ginkgonis]|uniref:Serine hydrolase n=1 Tax=Hufsiella ginkgonis TaxID=2695274 RepID=A0A7K1XSA2_9SPHI|nr:serine hydrolase [Hufsiella ginkgonis]MXV13881.1 serine hydrolase [Hufsiella ginkgonis]